MKMFTVTTPAGYYEATPSDEDLTKAVVSAVNAITAAYGEITGGVN